LLTLEDRLPLAGGLSVASDGPVTVAGDVAASGTVAVRACALTIRGSLQGAAVELSSAGLLSVAAGALVRGGRVGLSAGVLVNAGQVDADGVRGGEVAVRAGNVLQAGRVSADGAAGGGAVTVAFRGSYIDTAQALTAAAGGAGRGGVVTLEGGPGGHLFSSGSQRARGAAAGGAVALRGGDVALVGARVDGSDGARGGRALPPLINPDPAGGGAFGWTVTPLANGNVVVTNPQDSFVAAGSGAAYLFNGRTGALPADLVGGAAQDQVGGGSTGSGPGAGGNAPGTAPLNQVGLGGVTALSNGNYVVQSPSWNGNRGAVTWGSGTAGVSGVVGPGNSLVGTNPGDQVGSGGGALQSPGVVALANGNYVVQSPSWDGNRGAETWGKGTTGVQGPVDAGNSLVGSSPGDGVGFLGVTPLANGNYVVQSPLWDGGRGAATWGDGTAGVSGLLDASNSLVGSHPGDLVSSGNPGFSSVPGVTALSNGNYVVVSPFWDGNRGAATWGDGTAGATGPVDTTNSLVG
jgi:hypothetical protein